MSQQKFQLTHCDTPVYTCYSKQASSDFFDLADVFLFFPDARADDAAAVGNNGNKRVPSAGKHV